MVHLLTWNPQKKKTAFLQQVLGQLVRQHRTDVLLLQENYGVWVNALLARTHLEVTYPGGGVGSGVRLFLRKRTMEHFAVYRSDNEKLVFIELRRRGGKNSLMWQPCTCTVKLGIPSGSSNGKTTPCSAK